MDTVAYLNRQGWRGNGHALHHSGRGITKPIQISQKTNVYGIGKKKHDAHADQWWARAFDETLKGLNTTNDNATGKIEGISLGAGAQALQMVGRAGARWVGQSGLYSNFVRGESLSGTLTPEERGSSKEDDHSGIKVVDFGEQGVATTSNDTNRKKRMRDDQETAVGEPVRIVSKIDIGGSGSGTNRERDHLQHNPGDTESKEERRQRRRERKARKALLVANNPMRSTIETKIWKEEKLREKPASLPEVLNSLSDGTEIPAKRKKTKRSKHANG